MMTITGLHMIRRTLLYALFALMVSISGPAVSQDAPQAFNSDLVTGQEGIFIHDNNTDENFNEFSNRNEDPCPQPRAAYGNTPNDLKIIQEDITRFTLCVQRAQLLERLNSLAIENTDTIESALDDSIESIASEFAPQLPDITAPTLPDIMPPQQPSAAISSSLWAIKDIRGQDGSLTATLVNSGRLVNVEKGDTLPDNDGEITTISATEVAIVKNGRTIRLGWE
jgi:type IV pilus biogenesis protein PilP